MSKQNLVKGDVELDNTRMFGNFPALQPKSCSRYHQFGARLQQYAKSWLNSKPPRSYHANFFAGIDADFLQHRLLCAIKECRPEAVHMRNNGRWLSLSHMSARSTAWHPQGPETPPLHGQALSLSASAEGPDWPVLSARSSPLQQAPPWRPT